mmetsp:Transcript_84238/g.216890  ORF Transcript_84238/g.216890 Transcript_84238/m.216890 type:complete len:252 (+) Transcript_84238:1784-2539(+)
MQLFLLGGRRRRRWRRLVEAVEVLAHGVAGSGSHLVGGRHAGRDNRSGRVGRRGFRWRLERWRRHARRRGRSRRRLAGRSQQDLRHQNKHDQHEDEDHDAEGDGHGPDDALLPLHARRSRLPQPGSPRALALARIDRGVLTALAEQRPGLKHDFGLVIHGGILGVHLRRVRVGLYAFGAAADGRCAEHALVRLIRDEGGNCDRREAGGLAGGRQLPHARWRPPRANQASVSRDPSAITHGQLPRLAQRTET